MNPKSGYTFPRRRLPALRKIALPALAGTLALVLAGCPASSRQHARETPATQPSDSTPTTTAVRRDIEEAIEAPGVVESVNAPFDVKSEISGRIVRIAVEIGQAVVRGQTLLELDATALKGDLEEAARNDRIAKLELDRAERDSRRQEALFNEGFSTGKDRVDAKTEADFTRIKLELADAHLENARIALSKTVVCAPFDGFVSDLGVTVDQIVSGNGTLLMRVYDFSKLRVAAKFNEFDAARLAIGKTGVITFDSLPGVSVPGTIGYISPFASSEQNLRVFTAKVDFSPGSVTVRPGVSATVRIVTNRAKNAVALPLSAVFADAGDKSVYVKNTDGTYTRRKIVTGLNDTGFVEIKSGLSAGETVALLRPAGMR